jgi:cobalt-zinc-cadmium efflux system outer membrane protein
MVLLGKYKILFFVGLFFIGKAYGQSSTITPPDTLRLSLPEAETRFLTQNFQLLAQKYNINLAEAAIKQARLWANPNLFFESNFYNPATGRFFAYGPNTPEDIANSDFNRGAMAFQLQQLIYTASKRSKLVRLAESNRTLKTLAFSDLLRVLRYQLHSTYAELFFDVQSYRLLQNEAAQQATLVQAMEILQRQGGVSAYEVTRLEAELQGLQTDMNNLRFQIADEQAALRTFLGRKDNVFIEPTEPPATLAALPPERAALDSALANRPDVNLTLEQVNNAQRSLELEKARRVPDLTAGFTYERYGNAYPNYTGLSIGMDLPFFNRNQGNVRAAQIQREEAQKSAEGQQVTARNEVLNAYQKLEETYRLNAALPADYRASLQNISREATQNYNRRVINLLDYLDKIRTYRQAQLRLIDLQNNIFQSQQYLNFVTNTKFF